MKFPVNSLLAGNSETGSLVTPSSSGESNADLILGAHPRRGPWYDGVDAIGLTSSKV